jgi:hypothetical protein
MAQYNNPRYRRPSTRPVYSQPRATAGLAHAMNNRVFVPDEPILPAAPGGIGTPAPAGEVNNPFFQGEGPAEFQAPQVTQYYGDGGSQTSMPMEEFLYQQQGKLEAQKHLQETQLEVDKARMSVNESLMTGEMDPGNPLVVESMQAMGMEVTPSMLGQKTPNPNLVIQNIYGAGVASGNVPNKQQNMIIEARRTSFANAQARKNQYIEENRESLTESDILSFEKQLYDSYPEFSEGIQAPKTSDEILAERDEAQKQDFIKRTQPIAQQYGMTEMPYKKGKDGTIEIDATATQAMMAAKNNSRSNLNAVSSQAYNLMTAKNREVDASLPPKPSSEFAPGYDVWLAKYTEAQKQKAQNAKEYREYVEAAGMSPDPRSVDDSSLKEGAVTPKAEAVSEEIPAYSAASIDAAAEKGLIQPGVPLYYEGVLGTFDANGKWTSLNR